MNHFHLVIAKLKECENDLPGRSLGQILYAALHLKYSARDFTKGDLFEMTDKELYGLLSRSHLIEKDNDVDIEFSEEEKEAIAREVEEAELRKQVKSK